MSAPPLPLLYNLTLDQVVESLGQHATITLINQKQASGYIYTIDPDSGNVVLFQSTEQRVMVVMSHFIQDLKIDSENQIDLQIIDTILKYQQENKYTPELVNTRKEELIQLLEKNRIPIHYSINEPVIHVLGSARVESPYAATSVVCDNALIRKRVRDLILQLSK